MAQKTETSGWSYLALQDPGEESPTGVLRYDSGTGVIQQNDGEGDWFPARSQADMVFFGEPGTKDIDEKTANDLLASGTLRKLDPETKSFISRMDAC